MGHGVDYLVYTSHKSSFYNLKSKIPLLPAVKPAGDNHLPLQGSQSGC